MQLSGWAVFLKGNWDTATFVTNYIPLVLFFILYAGARLWKRSSFKRPEDMDFLTGLDIVEAASYDEPPPRNWVERFWAWLVSTFPLVIYIGEYLLIEYVSRCDNTRDSFCHYS